MAMPPTPGVYIEEWRDEPRRQLRTGVPGFLALARKTGNPLEPLRLPSERQSDLFTDAPNRYSRWAQFEEAVSRDSQLTEGFSQHAIKGFFASGGRLCYVHKVEYGGDFPTSDLVVKHLEEFDKIDDVDLICVPDIMWPAWRIDLNLPVARGRGVQEVLQALRTQLLEHGVSLTQQATPISSYDGDHWTIADDDRTYFVFGENGNLIARATNTHSEILQMQAEILTVCDRQGRRFAVFDSLPGADTRVVKEQRESLQGDNGALYYPWIKVPNGPAATQCFIPPSGQVAAIYTRSDERVGVHKAPANEALVDVIDLERAIDNGIQDQLNPIGVNCLRAFPGRGIRVWGARTLMSTNEAPTFVNVRRIFLTAARWIDRNMAGYAFEPHTPDLWARITRDLTAYFTDLWRSGALVGSTPDEAFFVKCNAETNPDEDRDQGRVVAEIGLAPTTPHEFIVVRIIQLTSGINMEAPGRLGP